MSLHFPHNPKSAALALRAAMHPNATQREAPFIAIAGMVPPHKDLNEPPFLALLVINAGTSFLWQEDGYNGYPIKGEMITLNLHKFHRITVGRGEQFLALYGAGQTAEEAELNLLRAGEEL